jgi:hypothetical protein
MLYIFRSVAVGWLQDNMKERMRAALVGTSRPSRVGSAFYPSSSWGPFFLFVLLVVALLATCDGTRSPPPVFPLLSPQLKPIRQPLPSFLF